MEQNKVAYYRQRMSDFKKRAQLFDDLKRQLDNEFRTVQSSRPFVMVTRRIGYFVKIHQTMDEFRQQHLEELERFAKEMENESSPAEKEELASDLVELISNRVDESSSSEEEDSA
jgi:hypothetical protein